MQGVLNLRAWLEAECATKPRKIELRSLAKESIHAALCACVHACVPLRACVCACVCFAVLSLRLEAKTICTRWQVRHCTLLVFSCNHVVQHQPMTHEHQINSLAARRHSHLPTYESTQKCVRHKVRLLATEVLSTTTVLQFIPRKKKRKLHPEFFFFFGGGGGEIVNMRHH